MGSRRVGLLTELFFYCTIFLEYSRGTLTEVDVLIICGFAEVLCLLCVFSIEARKLKKHSAIIYQLRILLARCIGVFPWFLACHNLWASFLA